MSAGARGAEGPHPLAQRLASALPRGARVLLIGAGRGRSLPALHDAGFVLDVTAADDATLLVHDGPYDAVLSTHALLHGTPHAVASRLASIAERLTARGLLYATFGSKADTRYATGVAMPEGGWAPASGTESGVLHASFAEDELRRLLHAYHVTSAREVDVAEVAGRWAHAGDDAPSVHWFVEARRR